MLSGQLTGDAPLDTAVSRAVLRRVSDGSLPETLQIGTPHRVIAFGKHDALADNFDRAVGIAGSHGYEPTIRIAGGRAVVFHEHVVRFAWTVPSPNPVGGMQERFVEVAQLVVGTLESFGIEGIMGELPDEYCPGRYSVHIPGVGKVMGSGQRLARRASQIAGLIVVRDSDAIIEVLQPVYAALGLRMDASVTGCLASVVDVETEAVASRFTERIARGRPVTYSGVEAGTMALARELRLDHVPRVLA